MLLHVTGSSRWLKSAVLWQQKRSWRGGWEGFGNGKLWWDVGWWTTAMAWRHRRIGWSRWADHGGQWWRPYPVTIHHNTHMPTNTDNCTSWSSTLNPVTIKPFGSPVGPTIPTSAFHLEVFQLFFSEDLMENMVRECNRYASQVMGDEEFQEWRAMNVDKLKAFLGFLILMAIIHLPSIDDYWRCDPFMHYTPIADRISRDCFHKLSCYLHFVDNTTLLPWDLV